MFFKIKASLQKVWAKFLSLKRWQQILIVVILLGVLFSPTGEDEGASTATSSSKTETVQSPEPSLSPSESASPSPEVSKTPETPIEFRFSALRDLGDMRKDLSDARIGITQNGLGKFYWNVAEVTINLTQLKILEPREEYAERWNSKLAILEAAVDELGADDENLTITKAKAKLDKVLNAIPALEAIARSLAN